MRRSEFVSVVAMGWFSFLWKWFCPFPEPVPDPTPMPDREPAPDPVPSPEGMLTYVLNAVDWRNNNRVSDQELARHDGLAARYSFRELEKSKEKIINDLAQCRRLGKPMMLEVWGGWQSPIDLTSSGLLATGSWNSSAGTRTLPVPWRQDYQDRYTALNFELASLPDAELITHVHIPAGHSPEWHWRQTNVYAFDNADELLCQSTYDIGISLGAMWPGRTVIASIGDDRPWTYDAVDDLGITLAGRFGLSMHALDGGTSKTWSNYIRVAKYPIHGFESLQPSCERSFKGAFQGMLDTAESTGASWMKIYRTDA